MKFSGGVLSYICLIGIVKIWSKDLANRTIQPSDNSQEDAPQIAHRNSQPEKINTDLPTLMILL